MIERTLRPHVERLAGQYPVLTLTGPRQSGKTTLAKATFPALAYVSLESPAERDFATNDPLAFLAHHGDGVILDEVHRAPELPSYIQGIVDDDPRPGRFVLTGSHNFLLLDTVSQSLAGRTAVLDLLPLDLEEVRRFADAPSALDDVLRAGGYPRIHDRKLDPKEWLDAYTATYVERDVRSLLNVGDLEAFQTFLRLCAGRVGQLLNLSSLAADCGISHATARRWISVLEASFIVFRLSPFHANTSKRLIKTPKLYFHDSGLVTALLGINDGAQLATHPLRGAVFESWVVSEIVKQHRHRARSPRLSFYQERGRLEIDLVIEDGADLVALEIKAGRTPSDSYFSALPTFESRLAERRDGRWRVREKVVVFGGDESQRRSAGTLLAWRDLPELAAREA